MPRDHARNVPMEIRFRCIDGRAQDGALSMCGNITSAYGTKMPDALLSPTQRWMASSKLQAVAEGPCPTGQGRLAQPD